MNKKLHLLYVGSFFLVGIVSTILLAVYGYNYYVTPIEERFFQAGHNALKPSGPYGHGIGILGSLMMIFGVAIYMVRKRMRRFFSFGYLKNWLEFHIFLCSLGPVFVLYHTAFKFGGIVAVSFWSMVAVVLSGVAGRFIYVQIPRSIQGQEIGIKELNEMSDDLMSRLKSEFSINGNILPKLDSIVIKDRYKNLTLWRSFSVMIKDFFYLQTVISQIKKELRKSDISPQREKEILKLAKSKLIMSRRIGMLRTTQKLFRYWHIIHLPFAITMFVIMFIHIVVTIMFGYKWIF